MGRRVRPDRQGKWRGQQGVKLFLRCSQGVSVLNVRNTICRNGGTDYVTDVVKVPSTRPLREDFACILLRQIRSSDEHEDHKETRAERFLGRKAQNE